VIKTLLAHNEGLVRGALAFVLRQQDDIEVVAELDRVEELVRAFLTHRPDVIVVDFNLLAGVLPIASSVYRRLPGCQALVLAERRRSSVLSHVLASEPIRRVGFLAKSGSTDHLVDAVRRVARGEPYVDPRLVTAALQTRNPLTRREVEVLAMAARGGPVKEIAATLALSPGTVRNHVSRIITKTGARSRIEAVRIALESGWI
jgi:two-component system, NarL family, response regulator DesR